MMAPTKKKLRVRKKEKFSVKSSQPPPPPGPEMSPDSKCPICLDRFVNVASVGRCLHRFCFHCIREWSKNKAECPLCKQPFRSIFHSVKAENDFKEYVVLENGPSASTSESATVTLAAAAAAISAAATAGQNAAESTATHSHRSRATRSSQRRIPRDQDPNPPASSTERVSQLLDALFQQGPAFLHNLLSGLSRFHQQRVIEPGEVRPQTQSQSDPILHEMLRFTRALGPVQCPLTSGHEGDRGSPSSIINISEDDGDVEADVTEDNTQGGVPPVLTTTISEISFSQSAWDDETPGPSYSTLSHPQTEDIEPEDNPSGDTSAALEQQEHEDDDEHAEECMIVGYVKPMAERTPELVQLSSDSTEEEEEEEGCGNHAAATETLLKVETSLPSHEPVSLSPLSYPSTSHTERGENPAQSTQQNSGKISHQRRKEHASHQAFRRPLHFHSHTSSDSSHQSECSVKINKSHLRLNGRELRRRSQCSLGQSPTRLAERDDSSSQDLLPALSISVRDKSSKSFSPWDSPGYDRERKRRRRKRRREREPERSRGHQRETRNRHGDCERWLGGGGGGSSSSSDTESRQEKPAGKRKYKTRHLERTARRRNSRKSCERELERERSPSVEIVFERRAAETNSRIKRHKKRSRRKERVQNSPTIITIDSDSDHINRTEATGPSGACDQLHANPDTEANSNPADFQNRLTDSDIENTESVRTAASQDPVADYNERVSDFSDHTVDYQEHLD